MSDAMKFKGGSPSQFGREIAPKSHRQWQRQNEDESSTLQNSLTQWLTNVSESEFLFKKYVYENENLHDMDLRQHRASLHELLGKGEDLAFWYLDFGYRTGKIDDIKPHVGVIEQKIKELFDVLIAWHGPTDFQSDIPESFKQSAREVKEGKIVDLDI